MLDQGRGAAWHQQVLSTRGSHDILTDEIYQFSAPSDRNKPLDLTTIRVLLSLDKTKTKMDAQWINPNFSHFPQAWVKPYGKGRVFHTGFGHRAELYRTPRILQFYLDAIQFAAGDLEAPTSTQ
jgi:type 1 glutamine amidotransferase